MEESIKYKFKENSLSYCISKKKKIKIKIAFKNNFQLKKNNT